VHIELQTDKEQQQCDAQADEQFDFACPWRIRNFRPENEDLDSLAADITVPYPALP
jgi:hypothetical protein